MHDDNAGYSAARQAVHSAAGAAPVLDGVRQHVAFADTIWVNLLQQKLAVGIDRFHEGSLLAAPSLYSKN